MLDRPPRKSLHGNYSGIVPLVAGIAIALIMIGSIILVLLGGSISVHFTLP